MTTFPKNGKGHATLLTSQNLKITKNPARTKSPACTKTSSTSILSTAFVNHHQRAMEKPEQARFETFPSCRGNRLYMSTVPSFSAPDVPMSFSQADEPQDHWGEHSPFVMSMSFSHSDRQLETWEEHPSTSPFLTPAVPVSLSNENEQEDAWGEHPSNVLQLLRGQFWRHLMNWT